MSIDEIIAAIVVLWAVIDPIGTVPVFVSVTKGNTAEEKRKIALVAALTAIAPVKQIVHHSLTSSSNKRL